MNKNKERNSTVLGMENCQPITRRYTENYSLTVTNYFNPLIETSMTVSFVKTVITM